jgi:hypothetical protein
MRYRLVVRVTAADVGKRVTIRWCPAELEGRSQWMTDVLGILEEADDQSFKVRRGRDGQLVVIPRERAVAGKSYHRRRRHADHAKPRLLLTPRLAMISVDPAGTSPPRARSSCN